MDGAPAPNQIDGTQTPDGVPTPDGTQTPYQYDATGSMQLLETLASTADAALSATQQNDKNLTTLEEASRHPTQGTTLERKKFECAICGSVYATHSGLSRHKKKHLDLPESNATFPCEQCSKTYQSRQSLLRHIGEQHSNTLYKCQFCRLVILSDCFCENVDAFMSSYYFYCTMHTEHLLHRSRMGSVPILASASRTLSQFQMLSRNRHQKLIGSVSVKLHHKRNRAF